MFDICGAMFFSYATPLVVYIKYHTELWILVRLARPLKLSKSDSHRVISDDLGTMMFTQGDCMPVGRSKCRVGGHICIRNVQNPYDKLEVATKPGVTEDSLYWSRSPSTFERWCGMGSATHPGLKAHPTWRIRYTATYSVSSGVVCGIGNID